MRWNAKQAARQTAARKMEVSAEVFGKRVETCETCPARHVQNCSESADLINIKAALKSSVCPRGTWPGPRTPRLIDQPLPADPPPIRPPVETCSIITTHFNPCGYRRLRDNYARFLDAIDGPVITAEIAYDDDPFDLPESEDVLRFRGTRARNMLWQKERLLNLLIERCAADAIAWIDSDMLFMNGDFLQEGMQKLDGAGAVQLATRVHYTNQRGEISRVMKMRIASTQAGQPATKSGYMGPPGGCWMARRSDLLAGGGLYDRNIIGGGDSAAVYAWEGRRRFGHKSEALPFSVSAGGPWRADWERWADQQAIDRTLDCCSGDVIHLYHGSRENRRYADRYKILRISNYHPVEDVEIGENGLLQWTGHALAAKPEMIRRVRDYFHSRREDD